MKAFTTVFDEVGSPGLTKKNYFHKHPVSAEAGDLWDLFLPQMTLGWDWFARIYWCSITFLLGRFPFQLMTKNQRSGRVFHCSDGYAGEGGIAHLPGIGLTRLVPLLLSSTAKFGQTWCPWCTDQCSWRGAKVGGADKIETGGRRRGGGVDLIGQ